MRWRWVRADVVCGVCGRGCRRGRWAGAHGGLTGGLLPPVTWGEPPSKRCMVAVLRSACCGVVPRGGLRWYLLSHFRRSSAALVPWLERVLGHLLGQHQKGGCAAMVAVAQHPLARSLLYLHGCRLCVGLLSAFLLKQNRCSAPAQPAHQHRCACALQASCTQSAWGDHAICRDCGERCIADGEMTKRECTAHPGV